MSKIESADIKLVLEKCIAQKTPFAFYRLPKDDKFHFIAQTTSGDFNIEGSGFVFHPFIIDANTPKRFIKAEYQYSGDCKELAELSFNIGDSKVGDGLNTKVSKDEFCKQVEKAINTIKNGSIEKVILSRVVGISIKDKNPVHVFSGLCEKYQNAFASLVVIPGQVMWITASPELLVSADKSGVSTVSVAGTKHIDKHLPWGKKEKAEQQIVTDYIHEILKKHCTDINIDGPKDLIAGNILHLQTIFNAKLKSDLWSFVSELHPTPAICGVPKDKAISFIHDTELHDRKYYTGFLGPCDIEGKTNLFVNLRCAELFPGGANLCVGGGITKDSVPELEWNETVMKADTLLSVLGTSVKENAV